MNGAAGVRRRPWRRCASAARWSATGQPSVCRTSSASSSSGSATPLPARRARASVGSIARSSGPTSVTAPRARSRDAWSGGVPRDPTARRAVGGRRNASSATASRHWSLCSSSAPSMTRTTGPVEESAAATRWATMTGTGVPGGIRRRNLGRVDRRGASQGGGEVGEQHRRVVVLLADREPGDRGLGPGGPLAQQRGLAVAGRGGDGQHRHVPRLLQPGQEAGPHDRVPVGGRQAELRLLEDDVGPEPPRRVEIPGARLGTDGPAHPRQRRSGRLWPQ